MSDGGLRGRSSGFAGLGRSAKRVNQVRAQCGPDIQARVWPERVYRRRYRGSIASSRPGVTRGTDEFVGGLCCRCLRRREPVLTFRDARLNEGTRYENEACNGGLDVACGCGAGVRQDLLEHLSSYLQPGLGCGQSSSWRYHALQGGEERRHADDCFLPTEALSSC